MPGVERVEVTLTAMTDEERRALFGPTPEAAPLLATGVRVIAVASGKGGVGKSTVAINLALALAARGFQVGILDADIYGFSVPRLLGYSGQPQYDDQNRLLPFVARGVKAMSMGSFVGEGVPVIWRGPLLRQALNQFLFGVNWGPLDYLVVDMPPGTGDVALDVAQLLPGSFLVLVTTPQRLAATVAGRVAHIARDTGLRLLGVVENMSYLTCPNCGERHPVFGRGGGQRLSAALGVPLLGQIPLSPEPDESGEAETAAGLSAEAAEVVGRIAAAVVELTEAAPACPGH